MIERIKKFDYYKFISFLANIFLIYGIIKAIFVIYTTFLIPHLLLANILNIIFLGIYILITVYCLARYSKSLFILSLLLLIFII